MRQQFCFDFCCCKSQIQRHYDDKNFRQKFAILIVSVSTMQCYIINNISKKQALNIVLTKCSSLQIFIRLYLQTLSNFIICRKTEVWTSLVENCRSFYAAKLCHICLCVYHARWIIYKTDFMQYNSFLSSRE